MEGFDIDLSGEADELPPGVQPGTLGGMDVEEPPVPEPETPVEETPLAVDLDDDFEAALAGDSDDWQPEDVDDEPFATEPEPRADEAFEEDVLAQEAADEEIAGGFYGDVQGAPETGAEQDAKPSQENPLGDEGAALEQGTEAPPDAEASGEADVTATAGPEPDGADSAELAPAPAPAPKPKAKPRPSKHKPKPKAKPSKSAPKRADSNGTSGTIARRYFIFEKTQAEIDGQIVDVFARVQFSDPDTSELIEGIMARNRTLALNKAGKLFGHGYEGTLIATPESMWEEKTVRNKPREEFRVEIS